MSQQHHQTSTGSGTASACDTRWSALWPDRQVITNSEASIGDRNLRRSQTAGNASSRNKSPPPRFEAVITLLVHFRPKSEVDPTLVGSRMLRTLVNLDGVNPQRHTNVTNEISAVSQLSSGLFLPRGAV
jgi:hypothetical protein